jgi:hypothetical protein
MPERQHSKNGGRQRICWGVWWKTGQMLWGFSIGIKTKENYHRHFAKDGETEGRNSLLTRKEKVMKIGFAVQTNEGMESRVYDHFGSAPAFIIVDTEGKEVQTVNNKDLNHVHGACNPVMALDGKSVNAMVVG